MHQDKLETMEIVHCKWRHTSHVKASMSESLAPHFALCPSQPKDPTCSASLGKGSMSPSSMSVVIGTKSRVSGSCPSTPPVGHVLIV